MLVAVGTSNELKVQATLEAFREFYSDVKVVKVEVESGVPPQPFDEEIFLGAKNRAFNALRSVKGADFGVGIEGGAVKMFGAKLITTAVCVVNKQEVASFGTTPSFPVPDKIWERMEQGEELGDIIDSLTGLSNLKKGLGAIGIFTKGKITRKDYLKEGVIMALVRFIADAYWS